MTGFLKWQWRKPRINRINLKSWFLAVEPVASS